MGYSYSDFPNGVTSFGVPLVGGLNGIPFTGNWWFVNAVTGSDGNASAGTGASPQAPLKTIAQAYSLAAEGNNDVIVLMAADTTASSTTGTFRISSQLLWAKSALHMVGMTAPTMIGQRARLAPNNSDTTNIADLFKVTANGCFFSNFSIFQGIGQASTAEQLCQITGARNAFVNVAFQGIGSANGGGQTTSYVVFLNTGGDENTFTNCQFGVDTVARTAACVTIKMRGGVTRNIFQNCVFPFYATGSGSGTFGIDSNATDAVDRFNWFKSCLFVNGVNSGGTAITALVSSSTTQGGVLVMDNCSILGITNYSATNSDAGVYITGSVPNGHTSGVALKAATS